MVHKVLSFRLGDELFGVEINNVKEINRNIEFTKVPRAPSNVIGLFNMRGQIVTLFNLAGLLGYDKSIDYEKATCIILKSESGGPNQRGFVIDKTGDVLDVDEDTCELPPANVDSKESKRIKTVARLQNELLRIVDINTVFGE